MYPRSYAIYITAVTNIDQLRLRLQEPHSYIDPVASRGPLLKRHNMGEVIGLCCIASKTKV